MQGRPHDEEETAELAKTADKIWLSDLGVLRGSFCLVMIAARTVAAT
jgi:hypothetical protein